MSTLGERLAFGQAIMALKDGFRVARAGWNGKGMWLFLQDGKAVHHADVTHPLLAEHATVANGLTAPRMEIRPWIGMFTADKQIVPWVASQSDILAEDWHIMK